METISRYFIKLFYVDSSICNIIINMNYSEKKIDYKTQTLHFYLKKLNISTVSHLLWNDGWLKTFSRVYKAKSKRVKEFEIKISESSAKQ